MNAKYFINSKMKATCNASAFCIMRMYRCALFSAYILN
jgi:hypothetical protein